MKRGLGLSNKEMGDVFAQWNKGVLDSFLIEITRDIVSFDIIVNVFYKCDTNVIF
jgi:6-phosphogluconate dehydrogenase